MKFEIVFCTPHGELKLSEFERVLLEQRSYDEPILSGFLSEHQGFYSISRNIVNEKFYVYQGSYISFQNKSFDDWERKVTNLARKLKEMFKQDEVWITFMPTDNVIKV